MTLNVSFTWVQVHEDRADFPSVPQVVAWLANLKLSGLTFTSITEGEFHVDLYTLPDNLIKMLWDFVQEKGAV
jgi:transcription initiation factor IIF auxiliary subunit